jgi:hypothetical protein
VYHRGKLIGKTGAVSRGETVNIPLDSKRIGYLNGSLTLVLKAAGTDAAYIKSKVSGEGALLKIDISAQ